MLKRKYKVITYLNEIIKDFPKISSGRKNYLEQHKRIMKNIKLINKFKKNLLK